MVDIMKDLLAQRMKKYEKGYIGNKCMPLLPICIRLDGRGFGKVTKGLERPFDNGFKNAMGLVTKLLIQETGAVLGYTQSDEITLILYKENPYSQVYFGGKVQKMVSSIAAYASVWFNRVAVDYCPTVIHKHPMFDCRLWQVPTKGEAANVLRWREQDARRNSIQMLAREHFSHKALQGISTNEMYNMLCGKGVYWTDYDKNHTLGQYYRRERVVRAYTPEEVESLPPKHEARTNPDMVVTRTSIERTLVFGVVGVNNLAAVIFDGAEPKHE